MTRTVGLLLCIAVMCSTELPILADQGGMLATDGLSNRGLARSAWPKLHGDAQNSGRASGRGATGTKRWEFRTGDRLYSPAIGSDGTLYFGSGNNVFAVDAATGKEKWRFRTRGGVQSSPAIAADGTVYVGTVLPDGRVYALDGTTGAKRWEFPTGEDASSPTIAPDGAVYVGYAIGSYEIYGFSGKPLILGGGVYSLDADTGSMKWKTQMPGYAARCPAIGEDGTVYVASFDGTVCALDPANGGKKWQFQTGLIVNADVVVGPDGSVYVGSTNMDPSGRWREAVLPGQPLLTAALYALDGATGREKWKLEMGSYVGGLAVDTDGTLYVSVDRGVCALDGGTRKTKWEVQLWRGRLLLAAPSPVIGSDGTLYVGSGESWDEDESQKTLYALDKATGAKKWEFKTRGEVKGPVAVDADGTVYVPSKEKDGTLYAIR